MLCPQGKASEALSELLAGCSGSAGPAAGPQDVAATTPADSTAATESASPGATADGSSSLAASVCVSEGDGAEGAVVAAVGGDGSGPLRLAPKVATKAKASAAHSKAAMRDLAKQLSSTARYTQVRRKRGGGGTASGGGGGGDSSSFAAAPAGSSEGGGAYFLYDIVCTDVDDGTGEARAAAKAERRQQAQERARRAAAEGAILMNYLPMVRGLSMS